MLFARALVLGIARHPHAAAFAARGFAHQAQLVFAGNRRGMHLNEFAVGVVDALLKQRGLRRTGADDGVRRAAENRADAAGAENDRVGREGFHFHGAQDPSRKCRGRLRASSITADRNVQPSRLVTRPSDS